MLESESAGTTWRAVRSQFPMRGIADVYLLQLAWDANVDAGDDPDGRAAIGVTIGAVQESVDVTLEFQLGVTPGTCGFQVTTRKV
jgi:hypothetical protein